MAQVASLKKAVRPLRNEADYDWALSEIEAYFDNEPVPGTAEADRFDLLALVIEDYEKRAWQVAVPDPVTAIRYRMETGGFSQADLGRLLGSRQRASEVLSGRRPITMTMAWKLNSLWGIPAEALLQPSPARGRKP